MKTIAALALTAAAMAGPAMAHHSFAMFDQARPMTLTGVVKDFQFTNPHAFIELEAGGSGWSIELNSPNNLRRQGWSRDSLKAGDRITAVIAPLKDGQKGGLFVYATLPDGKVLGDPGQAKNGPINAPGAP